MTYKNYLYWRIDQTIIIYYHNSYWWFFYSWSVYCILSIWSI